MQFIVITYYRYVEITDPITLRDELRSFCETQNILGRILLGKEGINGASCGSRQSIETFKLFLQSKFPHLTFREQLYDTQTFHKLVVRVRSEICVFGVNVDLKNKGAYIEPRDLRRMYTENEDFIIVDVRNEYEYDVGKFKNALKLPIKRFREFPNEIQKHSEWKNKKVVLYCTGGIRCEKASAYMREQGFNDVSHLRGGIINYVNEYPTQPGIGESYQGVSQGEWEGGLFVFDDRLVSDVGKDITHCMHCGVREKKLHNCHNLDCDILFVCCDSCNAQYNTCCSVNCKNAPRQRKSIKQVSKVLAKVEHYYSKVGVALISVDKKLEKNQRVHIKGKTTNTTITICEMRDDQGNVIDHASHELVTIPIKETVRKNDAVLLCVK